MRKKQVREREEGGGGWLVKRWLLRLTSSACTATAYCYFVSSSDPIENALLLFVGLWVKLGPH